MSRMGPGEGPSPARGPHRRNRWRGLLAGWLLTWGLAFGPLAKAADSPATNRPVVLRYVAAVRQLDGAALRAGRTVDLTGQVTYGHAAERRFFLADITGGLVVRMPQWVEGLRSGVFVTVRGVVGGRPGAPLVDQATVTVHGPRDDELEPRPVRIDRLLQGEEYNQWIMLEGVIHEIVRSEGQRLNLELAADGRTVWLVFPQTLPITPDPTNLLGARVVVRGVGGLRSSALRDSQTVLWVNGYEDLRVRESPPPDESLAIEPLGTASPSGERVKVLGRLHPIPGDGWEIRDGSGRARFEPADGTALEGVDRVQAIGFLQQDAGELVLRRARWWEVGLTAAAAGQAGVDTGDRLDPAQHLPVLLEVQQVRKLRRSEAQRGYPVRLRGVVTYHDERSRNLFLQDETEGIYVSPESVSAGVTAGSVAEVRGWSGPGDFAPVVGSAEVTLLERGSLPAASAFAGMAQLLTGRLDSQWVEVVGVVRAVGVDPVGRARFELTVDGRLLNVEFPVGVPAPGGLTDARVSVVGVCATLFNRQGQLRDVYLMTQGPEHFQVLEPPVVDPFALPPRAARTLGGYSGEPRFGHRVHVQGMVTARRSEVSFLMLDAAVDPSPLRVDLAEAPAPVPGARVEVVGFPDITDGRVRLAHAMVRVLETNDLDLTWVGPPPDPTDPESHGRVVEVGGVVTYTVQRAETAVVGLMGDGDVHGELLWRGRPAVSLPRGARIVATGICSHDPEDQVPGMAFALLLRSPGDVEVVDAPSKLLRYALPLLSLIGVIAMIAVGWIHLLRRQVRAQTAVIRDRLRAEAALEERYRLVWEHSADGMRLTDSQGRILQVNAAYCRLIRRSRQELQHQVFTHVYHESDRERILAKYLDRYARQLASPQADDRVVLWDGRVMWLAVSYAFVQEPGQGPLLLSTFRDVTERKQAEERLTHLHHCLLGFGGDAQANIERLVTFCGEQLEADAAVYHRYDGPRLKPAARWKLSSDFTGCGHLGAPCLDAPAARTLQPVVTRRDPAADAEAAPVVGGPPAGFALCTSQTVQFEGRPVGCLCVLYHGDRAMTTDQLNLMGIVAAAVAVEERRREEAAQRLAVERKLLDSQKLESLGVLAGGIAHDFNNLLTAILGNTGLLAMDLPPTSEARGCLKDIETTARQAAGLCQQMLAYSGRGRFQVQRLNLTDLVLEMRSFLQMSISKNAQLQLDLADHLPAVEADPAQLRQVVMNLVINASEALGDRAGEIRILTRQIRADPALLARAATTTVLPEGECVQLEVSDTGCGMAPETQARIFDPFFTTKFTGRGLGLAAVLGIVRGHRGALLVHSAPGHGSRFQLLLPALEGNGRLAAAGPERPSAWRGRGRILVADDEEAVRRVTERILIASGFEVLLAANGREAVEIAGRETAGLRAALLDLTMPEMAGDEAGRKIRELHADLPIILMSGFSEQEAVRQLGGTSAIHFLQKPFEVSVLRDKLRLLLGS